MNTDGHRSNVSFSGYLSLCSFLVLLTAFCLLPTVAAQPRDFTHWVDPFIGTGGHGHTFPGATMPFGIVQLSPDTRGADWDGSSGYHYSDDIIYGFSHTHLSGTGIPDYCDILFMPTVGEPQFYAKAGDKSVNGYASKFSHANEKAEPGYYSVKLDDDRILAELTTTGRIGFHRYSFPTTAGQATIILDLLWRDKVFGTNVKRSLYQKGSDPQYGLYLNVVSDTHIEGYRRSSSWAKGQIVYFAAEFSKPFNVTVQSISEKQSTITHSTRETTYGSNIKAAFSFTPGDQILLKVAISSVSVDGARKNLAAELPGWDFDKVRADARAAWNKKLSKIEVSGGTDAQTKTFYTALYHTMIQPNIFNDVDGNYRGHDGKVHNVNSEFRVAQNEFQRNARREGGYGGPDDHLRRSDNYSVFSLWDTFRAAHPLYTIIDQKRTVDFINTFIRMYEQGGRLPVWELAGNETDTMIGYHAVSVIADAMAKGIDGFDYGKAYRAAKHSAELDRDGLAAYKRRGYISQEDENESVSKTLEYAYDDWCIAQMARIMAIQYEKFLTTVNKVYYPDLGYEYGKDYQKYAARARYFENLFDPSTGFMRPKKNGTFIKDFAPNDVTFNYTEGNGWVYSFFVPQDISRLMELEGGPKKFAAKLDELFTTSDQLTGREQPDITGLIGQYAHGNEPSHHIAYLYDYAGQPWKTQKVVRKIIDKFYQPTPDGLIGNEDCGQMSAWYVMSASGFYEVTPGSGIYAFGTPLFPEVKYHLENGKTFTIRANGVSETNKYVASARLNGAKYTRAFIAHDDLMKGGVLEFEMTDKPVENAFTEFPSAFMVTETVAVPHIGDGRPAFREFYKFTVRSDASGARVFYTLDGSEPNEKSPVYSEPITITADTTVKAIAINSKGVKSQIAEARYHLISNDWTVKIDSTYNRQYTGGGDSGLIDGIRGSVNFASGEWQGYQGQDFVATVDLQKEMTVSKVGGGFLQVARSWIWMPTHIEFETSIDGVNFIRVANIKADVAVDDMESKIRDYTQAISPVTARFVRVHAYNLGKIPSWHPGAGDNAFIFIDEIFIG